MPTALPMKSISTRIIRAVLTFAVGVILPCALYGQSAPSPTPNPDPPSGQSADPRYDQHSRAESGESGDVRFMKEAADGGTAEVELGQLAQEKANSAEVKDFGKRMVKDHGQANDQLKQLASQKGVTLPTSPSPKNVATKERLSKLSGDAFDKAYMADMLKDHKKDIAAFQRESTSGKDPDVKQFASQTLPTLQDHLKQAESVSSKGQSTRSANTPNQ